MAGALLSASGVDLVRYRRPIFKRMRAALDAVSATPAALQDSSQTATFMGLPDSIVSPLGAALLKVGFVTGAVPL